MLARAMRSSSIRSAATPTALDRRIEGPASPAVPAPRRRAERSTPVTAARRRMAAMIAGAASRAGGAGGQRALHRPQRRADLTPARAPPAGANEPPRDQQCQHRRAIQDAERDTEVTRTPGPHQGLGGVAQGQVGSKQGSGGGRGVPFGRLRSGTPRRARPAPRPRVHPPAPWARRTGRWAGSSRCGTRVLPGRTRRTQSAGSPSPRHS